MFRIINVGTSALEYIEQPLVPDDVFAYKIVWNTGEKEGATLKVTAILSDGSVVYDTGSVSSDGTATYVLSGNMYSVSGSMELRLSIVSGSSVLTDRILYFTVLEGAGEDKSYAETKYQALDTLLVKANSVLGGAEAHLNNEKNPHSVTKEQVGLSNVDNTSDKDKPVSDKVREELLGLNPVGSVKANTTKTVLLPNLKGNMPIKKLFIGHRKTTNITTNKTISISLESASLIDCMSFNNWEQFYVNSTQGNALLDITHLVQPDENNIYPILGLSFELHDNSVLPQFFTLAAISKENGETGYPTSEGLLKNISGEVYFVSDDSVPNTKRRFYLDFSKVSDYITDDYRICLLCESKAFVSMENQDFFNAWLSRFKYLQLEKLESTDDKISDYYLGKPSERKEAEVKLKVNSYGGTVILEDALNAFSLSNSGTAKLILNTDDSYAAPTDIYVEYYEDADLKYRKMEVDLKKLISTNTTAIIANGGSE